MAQMKAKWLFLNSENLAIAINGSLDLQNAIKVDTISGKTDSSITLNSLVKVNSIVEQIPDAGVTVEGITLKNNGSGNYEIAVDASSLTISPGDGELKLHGPTGIIFQDTIQVSGDGLARLNQTNNIAGLSLQDGSIQLTGDNFGGFTAGVWSGATNADKFFKIIDADSADVMKVDYQGVKADIINELTENEGVTIEGVLIKDSSVTIPGNLIVSGTTTTIDTETLLIEDNLIVINKNQTGTPPELLIGGIEVERGDATNYHFIFQESSDTFRVGEAGSTQAVATRSDEGSMIDSGFAVWDATNKKFITSSVYTTSTLAFDSSVVKLTGNQSIAGIKDFTDFIKVDEIAESTTDAGVTVEGVTLKDNSIILSDLKTTASPVIKIIDSTTQQMALDIHLEGSENEHTVFTVCSKDHFAGLYFNSEEQLVMADNANLMTTKSVITNTIVEQTPDAGVVIDGLKIKDKSLVLNVVDVEHSSLKANLSTGESLLELTTHDGNSFTDFKIKNKGGLELFSIDGEQNGLATFNGMIKVNFIAEQTTDAGVTVENVVIKNGSVDGVDISNLNSDVTNHIANTSNPHSITKTQVNLGNVDNVQQLPMSYLDIDSSLTANSDSKVASQKAVKTYVDSINSYIVDANVTLDAGKIASGFDTANSTTPVTGSVTVQIVGAPTLNKGVDYTVNEKTITFSVDMQAVLEAGDIAIVTYSV